MLSRYYRVSEWTEMFNNVPTVKAVILPSQKFGKFRAAGQDLCLPVNLKWILVPGQVQPRDAEVQCT